MKLAILLAALALYALLSGCASSMPKVVTVEKPIPVPCIDQPMDRPKLKPIDPNAPDYELLLALWADNLERQIYINRLEAVLENCK